VVEAVPRAAHPSLAPIATLIEAGLILKAALVGLAATAAEKAV